MPYYMATSTVKRNTNFTRYELPVANQTNVTTPTLGKIVLFVWGEMVYIHFANVVQCTTGGTGWVTLFTVPSAYTPKNIFKMALIDDSSGSDGRFQIAEARISGTNFQIYSPVAGRYYWGGNLFYLKN